MEEVKEIIFTLERILDRRTEDNITIEEMSTEVENTYWALVEYHWSIRGTE